MEDKKWLTEEEQYQEILNNEQIERIKDPKLREIRSRHWIYRHKIFCDEENISDKMLGQLLEKDIQEERRELENYKSKIKK